MSATFTWSKNDYVKLLLRSPEKTVGKASPVVRNARGDSRVQWEEDSAAAAAAAATTMSADVSDVPPPHRKNPNADIDSL